MAMGLMILSLARRDVIWVVLTSFLAMHRRFWSTTAYLFTVGATVTYKFDYLGAYDRNHPNNTLVFIPSNVTHGLFQLCTQRRFSLMNFTQLN